MSNWTRTTLDNVIEITGGGTPKTSIPEYWNGEIPWLSVVDFNTGRKHVEKTEKTITNQGLENSSTKMLHAGDIIISARGTVGAIAVLKNPMAFNQSCYGIRAIFDIADTDFIYYLTKVSIDHLQQIAHGGVFDTITKETFKAIEISLPPLSEQKAIASVLTSLDDKIDLLHRQKKTLEAMAETLFRQWFVEEAEDSWKEYELKDLLEFVVDNRGKTVPIKESGIPLIATNCIKNYNIFPVYEKVRFVSIETYENWFRAHPKAGDIIFVNKGTPGCVNIVPDPVDFCIAQDMVALRVKKEKISNHYLFLYLRTNKMQNYILNSSVGTTIPHLKKTDLMKFPIIKPDSDILGRFSLTIEPLFMKMETNYKQSRKLTVLRDTLLPKLMNGEVKIKL